MTAATADSGMPPRRRRVPFAPGRGRRVRTPTVLQMQAVECGAAALAIVLGYHGRFVTLEELRVACSVSRDGANAANIVRAARTYGLVAKGLRQEVEDALRLPSPFIVFWNFNHFIVVEGSDSRRVFINDPAAGPRKITHEEFRKGFTGVCLTFEPGPEFRKGGTRRRLIPMLLGRLRGSRTAIAFVMSASLLLVVPGIVQPIVMKTFIDDILVRGFTHWMFPLVIGLLLSGVVSVVLTWLQQRYLLLVQTKLTLALAAQFFWHVLTVPVGFYSQRYVGDVAARVQSCQRLAGLLAGPLPTTVINCLMIVFFGIVMAVVSWQLTLLVLALTGCNVVALELAQRQRTDLNNVLLNESAKSSGAAMAGLQAIETLKASGTEKDFFRVWSGYQTKTVNTSQGLSRATTYMNAVPSSIDNLLGSLVLGGGALLVMDGLLTIGGMVAFQALMGHVTGPIKSLVGFGAQLQEIEGDLNRLDDVMRHPRDDLLTAKKDEVDGVRLAGRVELRDVSFGYAPLDPPLIENFNLVLEPGDRVALVGSSGSGKSTIAKLMLGVYQPRSGEILYDGRPLQAIPRDLASYSIASVDQDTALFEGTIAENLAMWEPNVPFKRLVRAAEDAQIHDVIAARPGGYHSPMAEVGANFSGGQRQRLEIARALVRDPSFLVLDEATSALDPLTEERIDRALRRRGCTCLIVAHRLSTIRDADEILVLERGKVIERGSHDELMALDGRYAALAAIR